MGWMHRADRLLGYATLERTRGLLAARGGRAMAVFFGVTYGLVSMLLGQMLVLVPNYGPSYTLILWSGNGAQPWNYPAVIVSAPWGILALPFFATVAMVVVSIGVGIGMSVSVLLLLRLLRQRRKELGEPAAVGSIAGLTPAMIALVTLGACCSTTAAASAGLGVVAQSSGTSIDNLLANNWYLGTFQMVILYVALLAQEQLIVVYGVLFGLTPSGPTDPAAALPAAPLHRRILPALLRAALIVAGVTWSLAVLADWTTVAPLTAPPVDWLSWVFLHFLLGTVAVLVALFPREVAGPFRAAARSTAGLALRAAMAVSGLVLLTWVPAPIAGTGVHGFLNELLGAIGAPSAWGAVAPGLPAGTALFLRWTLQFLLLGGFGVAVGLVPDRVLDPILGSSAARPPAATPIPSRGPHPLRQPEGP